MTEDEISELRTLWDNIHQDPNDAKRKFRTRLKALAEVYSMSELARESGIKRPVLYYHLGVINGDSTV